MSDERDARTLGRVIRLDLVIAVCALLISSLATFASFRQTVVVQKQLSAGVQPYVSVSGTFSPDEIKVALENYGLGPAIVRDAVLTERGTVRTDLVAYLGSTLVRLKSGTALGLSSSDIEVGHAIRPGDSLVVFDIKAKGVRDLLAPLLAASDLTVCYCSIIDQCWLASRALTTPVAVAGCNEHDPHHLASVQYDEITRFAKRLRGSAASPKPP